MQMRASQNCAMVHYFNWFGIFAFTVKYINCICCGNYLACFDNSYRSDKIGKMQMLLRVTLKKHRKTRLKVEFFATIHP